MDHLEGLAPGLPYKGPRCRSWPSRTTAGTGSEATKNAVLSFAARADFNAPFRDEG